METPTHKGTECKYCGQGQHSFQAFVKNPGEQNE